MSGVTAVVVGAGDMGARHAQHWVSAGARVLAVVDPDVARAEASAGATGAQAIADLNAALALKPDVVSVCTPTFLHARISIAALEAGAHVLCEKPIALSLADARAMQAAAAKARRQLRIGFMRRFDPAMPALVARVKRLGGPLLAQATITAGIRPKRLMHDATANGGPIIDMCCHLFDTWHTLFGAAPTHAHAVGYIFGDSKRELAHIAMRAIDSVHFTLSYPGGGSGQAQVSWGLPAGVPATETHAYLGPDGMLRVDWPASMAFQAGAEVESWTNPGGDPWQAEIAQFHAEITRAAERQVASVEDGTEALRISLAILQSVQSGAVVEIAQVQG